MDALSNYSGVAMPAGIAVAGIATEALQAAFAVIAKRLEASGYPVTGDISPGESVALDDAFDRYVRMLALNNDTVAALNEA